MLKTIVRLAAVAAAHALALTRKSLLERSKSDRLVTPNDERTDPMSTLEIVGSGVFTCDNGHIWEFAASADENGATYTRVNVDVCPVCFGIALESPDHGLGIRPMLSVLDKALLRMSYTPLGTGLVDVDLMALYESVGGEDDDR